MILFIQSFAAGDMEYTPNSRPEQSSYTSSGYLTVQRATIIRDGPRYLIYNTVTNLWGLAPWHESVPRHWAKQGSSTLVLFLNILFFHNRENITLGHLITHTHTLSSQGEAISHNAFTVAAHWKIGVPRIMLGSSLPHCSLTVYSFVTLRGTDSCVHSENWKLRQGSVDLCECALH